MAFGWRNVWLAHDAPENNLPVRDIQLAAAAKDGPLVIVILGGRGGQALHGLLGAMAKTSRD